MFVGAVVVHLSPILCCPRNCMVSPGPTSPSGRGQSVAGIPSAVQLPALAYVPKSIGIVLLFSSVSVA